MNPEILSGAASFGAVATLLLLIAIAFCVGSLLRRAAPDPVPATVPILLSLAAGTGLLLLRVVTDRTLVSDELVWHSQGLLVAELISGDNASLNGRLSEGKEGYAWLVGMLYSLAGPAPLVLIVLNVLLAALLVPLLAVITGISATELGFPPRQRQRAVRFAMYFVAIAPAIVFWSPRMLREVICMFLIGMAVMSLLLFLRERKLGWGVLIVVSILLMMTIRSQVGAGLAAGIVLSSVVVWTLRFPSLITRAAFAIPVFLILFYATWFYADSTADLSVENTTYRNRALTDAASAFSGADELQSASSLTDVVLFNLPRVVFGPFPQEINGSSVMLLAALSNIFWIASLVLAARLILRRRKERGNLAHGGQDRSLIVLIAISLAFVVILSIAAGNYGLVVRMRLMPFVTLIPLAGLGYALISCRHPRQRGPRRRHFSSTSGRVRDER